MRRRSFRSKLIAWNAGVVMILLALLGLGVTLASQARIRSDLDAELMRHGDEARRLGPPPGPPPQPPALLGDVPERYRPLFAPARRIANLREPRFFDLRGNILRPQRRMGGGLAGRPGPPEGGGPFGQGGPPGEFEPFDGGGPPERLPSVDAEGLRQALKGGEALRTVSYEGESLRVYSVPFVREGEVVGAVQLTRELREVDALMASQLMTLLLALPVAGLAAAGAAVALANRALRPIAIATRTASEIGGADLSRRLEVVGDDEMADLARTFNAMLARLEHAFVDIGTANERLARALESQRRFTADASHELRTPLTRLRLAIDSAVLDGDPERMRDALGIAARSSGQMARLVDQLLTLARVDAGQLPVRRERLDLRIVAAEALDSVTRADRVEAHFPSEAVAVEADPDHVRRIAVNLLENALRHTAEGRSVRLWVRPASGQAELVVADEGEGIPAEAVGRVFERFFRVDESRTGGGSGLGLAICRDLARANGGDLTLASELGVGTRAVLHLPVVTHRAIAARNDGS